MEGRKIALREFLPTPALGDTQNSQALFREADQRARRSGNELAGQSEAVARLIEQNPELFALVLERTATHAVSRALRPLLARTAALEAKTSALHRRDQRATLKLAERDERIRQLEAELEAARAAPVRRRVAPAPTSASESPRVDLGRESGEAVGDTARSVLAYMDKMGGQVEQGELKEALGHIGPVSRAVRHLEVSGKVVRLSRSRLKLAAT